MLKDWSQKFRGTKKQPSRNEDEANAIKEAKKRHVDTVPDIKSRTCLTNVNLGGTGGNGQDNGKSWLVFNGEIDLRQGLQNCGLAL